MRYSGCNDACVPLTCSPNTFSMPTSPFLPTDIDPRNPEGRLDKMAVAPPPTNRPLSTQCHTLATKHSSKTHLKRKLMSSLSDGADGQQIDLFRTTGQAD